MHTAGNIRHSMSTDTTAAMIKPSDYEYSIRSITLDFDTVPTDNIGNFFAIKGSGGKYIALCPAELVSSASTTTITMGSPASAVKFDPTNDNVGNDWNKYISFLDIRTGLFESNTEDGAQVTVSSVSSSNITLAAAFSADPAANDIMIPGGVTDASDFDSVDMVFVSSPVNYTQLEGDQIGVAYSEAALDYSKLPDYTKRIVAAYLDNNTVSGYAFRDRFHIVNYS